MSDKIWIFKGIEWLIRNVESETTAIELLISFPYFKDAYIKYRCKNAKDVEFINSGEYKSGPGYYLHFANGLRHDSVIRLELYVDAFCLNVDHLVYSVLLHTLLYGNKNIWKWLLQRVSEINVGLPAQFRFSDFNTDLIGPDFLDNINFVRTWPQEVVSNYSLQHFIFAMMKNMTPEPPSMIGIEITLQVCNLFDTTFSLDLWSEYFFIAISRLKPSQFKFLLENRSLELGNFIRQAIIPVDKFSVLITGFFNQYYDLGLNMSDRLFYRFLNVPQSLLADELPISYAMDSTTLEDLALLLVCRGFDFVNLLHMDNQLEFVFINILQCPDHITEVDLTAVITYDFTTLNLVQSIFTVLPSHIETMDKVFRRICSVCKIDITTLFHQSTFELWIHRSFFMTRILETFPRNVAQAIVLEMLYLPEFQNLDTIRSEIKMDLQSLLEYTLVQKKSDHPYFYRHSPCFERPTDLGNGFLVWKC